MKEYKLCSRCKKNKATMTFTNSLMDYTHGFSEEICRRCYDKIMKNNPWYKQGFKDGVKWKKLNF